MKVVSPPHSAGEHHNQQPSPLSGFLQAESQYIKNKETEGNLQKPKKRKKTQNHHKKHRSGKNDTSQII